MNTRKAIASCLVIVLSAAVVWHISACTSLRKLTLSKHEKVMFESFRTQVRATVDDPVRAEQLIEVGEDLSFKLHNYFKKLSKMAKKCVDANADYDVTPEQLESYYQTLDDYRKNMRETVLDARARAVALTTPEEWQMLSNRQNSMRDLLEKAPGLF